MPDSKEGTQLNAEISLTEAEAFIERFLSRLFRVSFFCAIFFSLLAVVSSADSQSFRVPFSKLTRMDQQAAGEVIHAPTLSRRVGGMNFLSRKGVYEYLLDHPDFAAAIARALKVGEYQITKMGNGSYWATDGNGVVGRFRVIYADQNERVFFLDGTYDKKWLPTIPAKAIVVLGFEHKTNAMESYVENNIDAYLKIDNALVAFLAKLLQGAVGDAMRGKMSQALELAAKISEEAYRDPDGFLKELGASTELSREMLNELREKLYPH